MYWYGRDNPEKIKYFIKTAVEQWGIKYVMLVGDYKKIPVRYVYNAVRCVRNISQPDTWSGTSTEGNKLSVYPNPTNDLCIIQTTGDVLPYEWKLFDSSGRMLQRVSCPIVNNMPIDLSNHSQEVYYICLVSEKESTTLKIIKQ